MRKADGRLRIETTPLNSRPNEALSSRKLAVFSSSSRAMPSMSERITCPLSAR